MRVDLGVYDITMYDAATWKLVFSILQSSWSMGFFTYTSYYLGARSVLGALSGKFIYSRH